MAKRGINVRQRSWLIAEIDAWRTDGLVSPEQAAGIVALYDTPAELAERGRSKLLLALTGIAALLVALAVLMLIAYNCAAMPAALKLVIIFAVLIGTYVAAFAVRDRLQRPIALFGVAWYWRHRKERLVG